MHHVGVDEAGKGPVLGPMVAAAVRAAPETLPDGVDDSKRLTRARRTELASDLRAHESISVGFGVVEPARIDDPATDMNSLTVVAQADAVAAVASEGDAVVADASDVDEGRFARRVRAAVDDRGVPVTVDAEHRADENHALVSAASIAAKVERDARIDALRETFGDVGSGYPSDQTTRAFLREYVRREGDLPACARASWRTCTDLLAAADQSALDEF